MFYAETQENDFWGKLPADSADTLRVKNFGQTTLSCNKSVFAFYVEIQDGRQKWQENNFWEKLPVDSSVTLQVKNFVKIALSRTSSEMDASLHFTQKFKMAAKNGEKRIFGKCSQ